MWWLSSAKKKQKKTIYCTVLVYECATMFNLFAQLETKQHKIGQYASENDGKKSKTSSYSKPVIVENAIE